MFVMANRGFWFRPEIFQSTPENGQIPRVVFICRVPYLETLVTSADLSGSAIADCLAVRVRSWGDDGNEDVCEGF